ncbi:MAG: histidinol-phosphate transaminase [Leptospirales bacterium]
MESSVIIENQSAFPGMSASIISSTFTRVTQKIVLNGKGIGESVNSNDGRDRFWSKTVRELIPYVPGEQPKIDRLVKLNTNENPYPPSPLVLEALSLQTEEGLRLYPDPDGEDLKKAISEYYGISSGSVFTGNGSDEVLAHTFFALLKQDRPLLFPDITYSFYPVWCGLYGIEYKTIPLTEDYAICVEEYDVPNGGIIIPNPNAPTGCLLSLEEITRLMTRNKNSVVVIDEAYIDFGGESAIPLIGQFHNLLVIQTLSKSRSLAGLRVGFAAGSPDLIEALERVKNSFNSYPLGRLAIAGAAAAFGDRDYFEKTRQQIIASREKLKKGLENLGFRVLPSAANFLFARHPSHSAKDLVEKLRKRGIIVRHFQKPRIEEFLRITVGTEDECLTLMEALKDEL